MTEGTEGHRVNGGGGYEAQSVEGIVRQIWHQPFPNMEHDDVEGHGTTQTIQSLVI